VADSVRPKAAARLLFIDNIRIFLTILVILHHTMIVYAGSGSWYYNEGREDEITGAIGAWFCAVNQAYFMGLFLLISAYFVPGAYDRKGPRRFVKDRLIRLGIPVAVYSWIIGPVLVYGMLALRGGVRVPFWDFYTGQYFHVYGFLGGGPTWFVEVLLIFSLVYVLWRLLTRSGPVQPIEEARFPGSGAIVLFAVFLAAISFLVRLWFPVGWNFGLLNLQFPFFVQYIALFVVGLIAFRRNWLLGLPDAVGRRWLSIAIVMIFLWWPGVLLGGGATSAEPFKGGWHWQALANALWESFMCLSMCIGLIYLFHRRADRQGQLARTLSRSAYAAYLLQGPLITLVALAARDIALYPLLKFVLAAAVTVPLCFMLGYLIRKLPYFDRVL
jgi:glucan biosynthesis protein C